MYKSSQIYVLNQIFGILKKNDSRIEWGFFDTSRQKKFERALRNLRSFRFRTMSLPKFEHGFQPTASVTYPSFSIIMFFGNYSNASTKFTGKAECAFHYRLKKDPDLDYGQITANTPCNALLTSFNFSAIFEIIASYPVYIHIINKTVNYCSDPVSFLIIFDGMPERDQMGFEPSLKFGIFCIKSMFLTTQP